MFAFAQYPDISDTHSASSRVRVKKKLRAKTTKIVRSYPRLRIERVPIDDIVPFEMYFSTACALTTQKKLQKIAAYLRSLFRFCDELLLWNVSLFFFSFFKRTSEGQIFISCLIPADVASRKREKTKKIKSSLTLCFRCDAYYVSTAHT